MSYFGILKISLGKTIAIFETRTLEFANKQIFVEKTRQKQKQNETSNLEQRMPYLGVFGLQLWKTVVTFGIGTLKNIKTQRSVQK